MIDKEELISEEEYSIIKLVRKLRPYDKIVIAKNQVGSKLTLTVIKQDQFAFDAE